MKKGMRSIGLIGLSLLALPLIAAGAEMPKEATSSGCAACHAMDSKVIGPSWKDINARYRDQEGAREMLIEKVKLGGAGNWTEVTGGVPMPPNAPRVPDEVIADLVDFILAMD